MNNNKEVQSSVGGSFFCPCFFAPSSSSFPSMFLLGGFVQTCMCAPSGQHFIELLIWWALASTACAATSPCAAQEHMPTVSRAKQRNQTARGWFHLVVQLVDSTHSCDKVTRFSGIHVELCHIVSKRTKLHTKRGQCWLENTTPH